MSNAIAVFHGTFGRVCLYALDRGMVPHGHREGHLTFHVQGPPASIVVDGTEYPLGPGQGVAVSPWQQHYYRHGGSAEETMSLVLYIRPAWFLEAARREWRPSASGADGFE